MYGIFLIYCNILLELDVSSDFLVKPNEFVDAELTDDSSRLGVGEILYPPLDHLDV